MNELDNLTEEEINEGVAAIIAEDLNKNPHNDATNYEGKNRYEYRIICIASRHAAARPVFAMPLKDAMILCSDKSTSWQNSFACMRSLDEYDSENKLKAKEFVKDNGSMDELIQERGLRKIELDEARELFYPYGII